MLAELSIGVAARLAKQPKALSSKMLAEVAELAELCVRSIVED